MYIVSNHKHIFNKIMGNCTLQEFTKRRYDFNYDKIHQINDHKIHQTYDHYKNYKFNFLSNKIYFNI